MPPGTYTLTAWHEAVGIRKQTVVIEPEREQQAFMTLSDKDKP